MNETTVVLSTILLFLVMPGFFAIGLHIGSYHTVSQQEVINHGAAHYDPKTAKFTWNTSATTPLVVPRGPEAKP